MADIRDIGAALEEMASNIQDLTDKIGGVNAQTAAWNNILEEVASTAKDLPDDIASGADLWKQMTRNAKLFKQVQEQIRNTAKNDLQKILEKNVEQLEAANASTEQWNKMFAKHAALEKSVNKIVESRLRQAEKMLQKQKEILFTLQNVTKTYEEMGQKIRAPSKAVDGMLMSMGDMPGKILAATQEAGGLGKAFKAFAKEGIEKVVAGARLLFSPAGLLIGGLVAVLGPLILVWNSFKQLWDFMDKKVMPTVAGLNKEFGNMGESMSQLKSQAVSTGVQFELLGKSFEEGAKQVKEIASAMMTVHLPRETLQTTLKLSEYVGLGGERAGKLALAFEKTQGNLDMLNSSMKGATKIAHQYGVPVNQVRRDMGENLDILQRFGTQNAMTFMKSAAVARSYGLTIKEVNQAFGKQLDTFENSSTVAAKLNSIFGTTVNSMELMMETDPTKKMEMLRKELVAQGKEWNKLDVSEKNVITSTLNISEEQAALVLSSDKVRKTLQAQAAERAKQNKINEDWERGLSDVKETLLALEPLLNNLLRKFAGFVLKLFGEDPSALNDMGQTIEKVILKITEKIEDMTKNADKLFDSPAGSLLKYMFGIEEKSQQAKSIQKIQQGNIKDLATFQLRQLKDLSQVASAEMQERFMEEAGLSEGKFHSALNKAVKELERRQESGKLTENELAGIGAARAGRHFGGRFVQDALITKKGEVIQFHPNDNILATKSPVKTKGSGATATAGNANVGGGEIVVTIPIYLDSRKISEQQVRASRR